MGSNSYRLAIPALTGGLAALLSAILVLAPSALITTSAPPPSQFDTATVDLSTPTPEPTSIAQSILGVEPEAEQTWMIFVPMARMADALRALDPLLSDPQLGDADWTTQVMLQIDTVHTADRHLWDLEFLLLENEFYHQTMDATGWCKRAADHLEVAVEEARHDKLTRAQSFVQHCRMYLKQLANSRLTVGQ